MSIHPRFRLRRSKHWRAGLLLPLALPAFWPVTTAQAVCPGETAPAADSGFVVALFNGGQEFCTGTLLAGGWVLTAAHCKVTAVVRLHQGKPDLQGTLAFNPPVHCHDFNGATLANDIALIQLKQPLPAGLGNAVLVDPAWVESAQPLTIAGNAKCAQLAPPILRSGAVAPFDINQCRQKYHDGQSHLDVSPKTTMCTSIQVNRVIDADSGGPLLAADGRLAGVISSGRGIGSPPIGLLPDRHMRLTAFRDWIDGVMKGKPGAAERDCQAAMSAAGPLKATKKPKPVAGNGNPGAKPKPSAGNVWPGG